MASNLHFIPIIPLFFILSSLLSPATVYSAVDNRQPVRGDINSWCATTPHPATCKFFMARAGYNFKPKCRDDFRTMTVEVAMERALHSQRHAKELEKHCHSRRKKMVWLDCDKLVDDTIFQLNNTAGSVQLNVSHFFRPVVSFNITELISNSLAVNGVLLDEQNSTTASAADGGDDGREFPSWLTAGDRRLLQSASVRSKANYVVSKDGKGQFRSIQAAINYATSRRKGNQRIVIYIKRGVYNENVQIGSNMNKIMLVGDGLRYTIITGSRSVASGFTTYSTATVGVDGLNFIARGITFRNTAGPQKAQAVALRSASDLSVFYACSFEGYQDTLFVLAQRQFYKSCYIYGTIDFIFGNAAVVFQNCVIYVRKPLWGQSNVVTAQGRADPFQNTGISIHNCRVMAAPDLKPVVRSYQTYLGRPWQQYSRTVFLKTYLDGLVNPQGWMPWENSKFGLTTLYYGEYKNFGPGGSTRSRVKWPGYHIITSSTEASKFTVASLIAGRSWLPSAEREMRIFAVFLVSLVLTVAGRPVSAARDIAGGMKTTEYIKVSCEGTPYPELCSTTLSKNEREIGKDTALLVHTAINAALELARSLSGKVADVAHNKTLPPEAATDTSNCVDEINDSIHKLKMSLVEMKQLKCPGFDDKIYYIHKLVTTALIDDDRCTNGLNDTGLNVPAVKEQISTAAHMTLNALTLINKFADTGYIGRKNIDFVKTSCDKTPYPNICYASIVTVACEISGDPKLLAKNAIALTQRTTEFTVNRMGEIAGKIGLSPKENMSIHVCEDLSHKSIGYMQDTLTNLETLNQQKGADLKTIIDDIKEWLKSVKSNFESCIEELEREKINPKVTEQVTQLMREEEPYSEIALALFSSYAAGVHGGT
nr:probable pectinesterase/pectinesterase inhibitor 59 [Ipomoea batatas]